MSGTERPPRYPRTPCWPWSPSNPPAHRLHPQPERFTGREIVITEKLDGTNTALRRGQALTRGGETPPWLQAARKHHAWKTANLEAVIYGEDLLGIHAIEYAPMPEEHTLRAFAALENGRFASWDQLEALAAGLGILTVPVLFRGVMKSLNQLRECIMHAHRGPSPLGGEREGVVVRVADSFTLEEFPLHVAKSVRAGHVKSDEHWSRNWRRARTVRGTGG